MENEERSGNGDENLAIGDTPSGNPPFIVYKKRLYVLSKKPPQLGRAGDGRRGQPLHAVEVRAGRAPAQKAFSGVHGTNPARPRVVRRRTRPYIKGTYRVYSSKFPHLAPADRRKNRKRMPRSSE